MKWLFIFLLLGNVLYFGWELDRQTRMDITPSTTLATRPASAKQLKFLEELDTLPALSSSQIDMPLETLTNLQESSVDLSESNSFLLNEENEDIADLSSYESTLLDFVSPEELTVCFTFGPIANENQATTLRNWFEKNAGRAYQRHTDEQGRQLFWVYLAPQESREEAMATIRTFQNKGVSDYRLIVKGNLQNAISMGLFSSQASVNKRLSELKKKGLKAVVVPYADGKRVYWIDAMLADDKTLLSRVLEEYPAKFSSLPVKCEEIAIDADYS
ncbi:MAG: hypothetical protein GKR93_09470 [Gammaproteobacteria bacterium]|nr:hypothetical protein [Gammaproteobacteria bacterium]